jgi:hypothetical protein
LTSEPIDEVANSFPTRRQLPHRASQATSPIHEPDPRRTSTKNIQEEDAKSNIHEEHPRRTPTKNTHEEHPRRRYHEQDPRAISTKNIHEQDPRARSTKNIHEDHPQRRSTKKILASQSLYNQDPSPRRQPFRRLANKLSARAGFTSKITGITGITGINGTAPASPTARKITTLPASQFPPIGQIRKIIALTARQDNWILQMSEALDLAAKMTNLSDPTIIATPNPIAAMALTITPIDVATKAEDTMTIH